MRVVLGVAGIRMRMDDLDAVDHQTFPAEISQLIQVFQGKFDDALQTGLAHGHDRSTNAAMVPATRESMDMANPRQIVSFQERDLELSQSAAMGSIVSIV